MRRYYILTIILSLFIGLAQGQDKYNLDETSKSRFNVTDKVWPTNVGEVDVCLWKDDKLAAFTITIDDNNESNIPFWKSMNTKYGFDFTWFLITEAENSNYNVTDDGWIKYNELAEAGNQINGHDDRNYGGGFVTTPVEYYARLKRTQDKVDSEITTGDNKCLTYAYPFGEGIKEEARKLFIAIRGTNGVLNHADKANYLDINSVSNPYIFQDQESRDTYILPLINTTSKLYNVNYFRGWGSTHFHGLNYVTQQTTDAFLKYLKDKGDTLWVAGFTRVAQYSQSYATHSLTVDATDIEKIKFTLTDQMLDSAYDFALTVKVRISNEWNSIEAIQNGAVVEAVIVEHEGDKYALVEAIPDGGEVTVTGSEILSSNAIDANDFTVYPNPVNGDVLNIILANSSFEQQNIEIIGLTGKIVYSSILKLGEIRCEIHNINQFTSGIYFLRVSSKNNVVSKKIIIN